MAGLLILFSDGSTASRLAATVAVLAVVLIGMSITLRRDSDTGSAYIEEVLLDEIEALHGEVREDIKIANRATQNTLGNRVLNLHETVEALRGQLDALRTQLDRGTTAAPAARPVGHAAGVARPASPAGVVRHTETVKVTMRSTILDPNEPVGGRAAVHAGNGSRATEPEVSLPRRASERSKIPAQAEPAGESWTEQMLRQRRAEQDGQASRRHGGTDADRITGVRASDRWASVRSDDHGRELRIGERHAAVHAGESGTEVHTENGWAAVLRDEEPLWREEPPRGVVSRHGDRGWSKPGRGDDHDDGNVSRSDPRWGRERADEPERWTEPSTGRHGYTALPAATAVPASTWTQKWDEQAEPVPAFQPRRSHSAEDNGSRRGGVRHDEATGGWSSYSRGDHDFHDDRWR